MRARGVRLVHHIHDVPNARGWLDWWANGTLPDAVLCNSEFTRGCAPWYLPKRARHVVYAPIVPAANVHVADRERTRAAFGLTAGDVVILTASRLESWKGHPLLIAALAELRDEPRWTCWIAGGPQRDKEVAYYDRLKEDVRRFGLADRVRFLGQRDDVPALMRAADIHCQSNVGPEPFGQVFVEALAAGLPVVTTDMGGGREIVNDACGLRVAPEPGAVAGALRRLIGDPALRARLAQAGPARAKEMCDPPVRMGELEAILGGVVQERAETRSAGQRGSQVPATVAFRPIPAPAAAGGDDGRTLPSGVWRASRGTARERPAFAGEVERTRSGMFALIARALRDRRAGRGSVVDLGCGEGEAVGELAGLFARYVGCDATRHPRFPDAPAATFCAVDLDRAPYPVDTQSADVVTCFGSISLATHPSTVLREMVRIARPGGWVVVTAPNRHSIPRRLGGALKRGDVALAGDPQLGEDDLRRIAHECGLVDVAIDYVDGVLARTPSTAFSGPPSVGSRWLRDHVVMIARRP